MSLLRSIIRAALRTYDRHAEEQGREPLLLPPRAELGFPRTSNGFAQPVQRRSDELLHYTPPQPIVPAAPRRRRKIVVTERFTEWRG